MTSGLWLLMPLRWYVSADMLLHWRASHTGEGQGWLLLFDALTKNLSLTKLYSGSPKLFINQGEISIF